MRSHLSEAVDHGSHDYVRRRATTSTYPHAHHLVNQSVAMQRDQRIRIFQYPRAVNEESGRLACFGSVMA